jgi:hypothetical protein
MPTAAISGSAKMTPWDAVVGRPAGSAADGVGRDPCLVFGDVGEQGPSGDVADGPQPVAEAAVFVDG